MMIKVNASSVGVDRRLYLMLKQAVIYRGEYLRRICGSKRYLEANQSMIHLIGKTLGKHYPGYLRWYSESLGNSYHRLIDDKISFLITLEEK